MLYHNGNTLEAVQESSAGSSNECHTAQQLTSTTPSLLGEIATYL